MKNTLIILTLLSVLSACGDNQSSQSGSSNKSSSSQSTQKAKNLKACSVLSEDYIKSAFAGATEINLREGKSRYPNCGAQFKMAGLEYNLIMTLGVIGNATVDNLETSVSFFRKKSQVDALSGVGEKAYFPQNDMNQISAINKGNLIHVGAYKDNKFDLELTKKITNDMFAILEK